MRIKFDHPAVVTGLWENGNTRRELVRVPSEFEIREFSHKDAPLSFTVIDDASGTQLDEYRMVEGRHYRKWDFDQVGNPFEIGSSLLNSVYSGSGIDFTDLSTILRDEIALVRKNNDYRTIENTERAILRREKDAGLDVRSVAMMKAPLLRKWRWLGNDVDAEVADWKSRTADVLDKIVLVEGVPYHLVYEPCYCLVAAQGPRSQTAIQVQDTRVFGKLVAEHPEMDTGFEPVCPSANIAGSLYFPASERAEAERVAEALGWHIGRKPNKTISVHLEGACSPDFMERETIRHARMIYDRVSLMVCHVRQEDGFDLYRKRRVDPDIMRDRLGELGAAIRSWQSEKAGTDHLYGPMESVMAEAMGWEEGNSPINGFNLPEQIAAFRIMEDMHEVAISPKPWSPTIR